MLLKTVFLTALAALAVAAPNPNPEPEETTLEERNNWGWIPAIYARRQLHPNCGIAGVNCGKSGPFWFCAPFRAECCKASIVLSTRDNDGGDGGDGGDEKPADGGESTALIWPPPIHRKTYCPSGVAAGASLTGVAARRPTRLVQAGRWTARRSEDMKLSSQCGATLERRDQVITSNIPSSLAAAVTPRSAGVGGARLYNGAPAAARHRPFLLRRTSLFLAARSSSTPTKQLPLLPIVMFTLCKWLPALLLACAFLGVASAQSQNPNQKAKLHTIANPNLCVALGDGTYNRDIVLRPCSHELATWAINKNEGKTFIRHINQCLNGAYFALDWGFNVQNGNPAYGQLCQDEALRYAYDLWQEGGHDPWRWERLSTGQFRLFGFPLNPCLDIKDGRVQEGTKLQIWDCHPQGHPDYNNQKFNIEWLGPEYP
ncbi:hypothetical protein A1Q2_00479 [Trichosporon asahii var. asahii CBS 8904]|uniref:Uncharacterized protein n=1 Tax=Trichosporon asahii var. asahii (strain CBS 8904) TaxID=1220162 RepID=K1WX07_TRIAC|nr:hypothetical protein A1Q2_00479 [Trichosporon asahii var. asahii CBS 8904]